VTGQETRREEDKLRFDSSPINRDKTMFFSEWRGQDDPWIPKPKSYGKHKWFNFVRLAYLGYSVFFWIEPIQRNTFYYWTYFGLSYALFLGLYSWLVLTNRIWMRRAALIGLAILGYLCTPLNSGFLGLPIYIAAFLPFSIRNIRNVVLLLIAVCASIVAQGYFLHFGVWSCGICTLLALVTGGTNIIHAQQRRSEHQLRLADEQIAHLAKIAERERIARDLHDVLGHTLSVVVLKSELAGKLLQHDSARARKEIGEVEQIARAALGEVRQTIRGYRSEGLSAEIERARSVLESAGVKLECSVEMPKLSPAEDTVLSLLVREAVTNVIRHASASCCRIALQQNDKQTMLTIDDDGRGGVFHEGNGLRGMHERVESLGGQLKINSARGTRLLIAIPRPTQEQA
jgi:two-component system, NarL family, sensor histidine kinase DesK